MALTRRASAASAPFEPSPDASAPAVGVASAPAEAQASAPAPAAAPAAAPASAAAPAASSLVAKPTSTGLVMPTNSAVARIAEVKAAISSIKDALRVDWDTLVRLKFNSGKIKTADGKRTFGDWIDFELLSYQDNWMISPGKDTDEARDLARYSDDGVHVKGSGELCSEYIANLKKLDYPDARLSQRMVLVVSLLDCDKDADVDEGELFQIDVPPTTRSNFERYTNQSAFDVAKERMMLDQLRFIRATCSAETQKKANKDYTALVFTRTPAAT